MGVSGIGLTPPLLIPGAAPKNKGGCQAFA